MADPINEEKANLEQDETYNTSEPQEVNKQRKKYARTRADRLHFIAAAMQHEQGRAWFYEILKFCKCIETPYRDNPYDTAFLCGMQNVGLKMLDDIQTASPDNYLLMIKENKTKNG